MASRAKQVHDNVLKQWNAAVAAMPGKKIPNVEGNAVVETIKRFKYDIIKELNSNNADSLIMYDIIRRKNFNFIIKYAIRAEEEEVIRILLHYGMKYMPVRPRLPPISECMECHSMLGYQTATLIMIDLIDGKWEDCHYYNNDIMWEILYNMFGRIHMINSNRSKVPDKRQVEMCEKINMHLMAKGTTFLHFMCGILMEGDTDNMLKTCMNIMQILACVK